MIQRLIAAAALAVCLVLVANILADSRRHYVPPRAPTTTTTTTAPTPAPAVPSVAPPQTPRWEAAYLANGCPSGEVHQTNDGCVYATAGECVPSEATCDPANAAGGTARSSPSQVEPTNCGDYVGRSRAYGVYDANANSGAGGCIYTWPSGFRAVAPPGATLQEYVTEDGTSCDRIYWSTGSVTNAC